MNEEDMLSSPKRQSTLKRGRTSTKHKKKVTINDETFMGPENNTMLDSGRKTELLTSEDFGTNDFENVNLSYGKRKSKSSKLIHVPELSDTDSERNAGESKIF